jgi:hypothetical protein
VGLAFPIAFAVAVGLLVVAKVMRSMKGVRAGDFVKVKIPRTLERPLAMGTRLDMAAALKKRGYKPEALRPLLDGKHDQELLDAYWKELDLAKATVVK